MTKDLTVGNPLKVIVNYMIPVFLGLVLQQAYNLVDTIVIGWFEGSKALGGVGAASSLCLMVMGATMGLCAGFCIPISHAFGEKNETKLRQYLAHSIYLSAANAAVIMVVFLSLGGTILNAMGTLPENYDHAYNYVMVYFMGVPCAVLYNLTSGVMRAMGDSKTPLYFLFISSACNIVLDLIFVAWCKWGVTGAAWATNISQALSGTLCVFYMRKKLPIIRFRKGDMKWSFKHALHLLANGFPLALQYCITFVGTMIMQVAINGLGQVIYVNTVAVCNKINGLMNCTFNAIGPTMANFVGQNVGAKRPDRVRSGLFVGILISAVFSAIYMLMATFLTPQMMRLFLDEAKEGAEVFAEMVVHAKQFLMTMGVFSIMIGLIISHRFTMQGMGFAKLAIISGILELCARVLTAYVLVPKLGFTGVCLGSPAAWLFASCFVVPGAYICLGRLKKKQQAQLALEN